MLPAYIDVVLSKKKSETKPNKKKMQPKKNANSELQTYGGDCFFD